MQNPLSLQFTRQIAGIKRRIPLRLRRALYPIYYPMVDAFDSLFGLRADLTPPKRLLARYWNTNFHGAGGMYKYYLIKLGGLQPNHRVLDVGCGIGRVAVPLTSYLDFDGEYWGFDIILQGIHWCQKNISSRFPNFHFHHADIYNGQYNPKGKLRARDYRFPYPDRYFDFVFLTSVFTHILPLGLENYLGELSRVLRPGGKMLATLFLMDPVSRAFIKGGVSSFEFEYEMDGCWVVNPYQPEFAVAYDEMSFRDHLEKHTLVILEPIHYGSWCGRVDSTGIQDIVVATREI
jgi:SAM-dependent methyltransferase